MGEMPRSVEVRGRQRVRNAHLGLAVGLLLVAASANWSRSWGTLRAPSCLRAQQVTQAAVLAAVVALLLLALRSAELLLLPARAGEAADRAGARQARVAGAGALAVTAGLVAIVGVGLAVAATLRTGASTAMCAGPAVGTGPGASLVAAGLVALIAVAFGLVVWSKVDLPDGAAGPAAGWDRKDGATVGADPAGTVICCSGGGIRSAAFCLGGLQALDAAPSPTDPARTVYGAAAEVVGVSGGGYMAAAWHVARHGGGDRADAHGPGARTGETGPAGAPDRPFGSASPELRRLRRTTTYLASSGRVRADAVLSWLFGTVLMWAVVLAAVGVTAWVLSLFVDRLDLATGLDTPDATAWPSRSSALVACAVALGLGPFLYFVRRMLQMRLRRDTVSTLPGAIQNSVLPVIAAGTAATALLVGVPGLAVALHDLTVRNQPVPVVANVVHTLGFAPPGACDAATSDDTFVELYQREQARARALGRPVTFPFGACGSEIEVTASPGVDVAQVRPAARTALAFAPGVWQQLAASGAALALFGALVRSVLKGRRQQQPTGRGGGTVTFVRRRLAPWLATVLAVAAGFLVLVKWLVDDLLLLRDTGDPWFGGYWPPFAFLALVLGLKLCTSATWMSMHPFYRDRLRSAYLLRRRGDDAEPFDDRDLDFSDHEGSPDLVLCGTANLSDDELVPSGRQGAPFLFTTRQIGFDDTCNLPAGGVCEAGQYAGATPDVRISAAIAISGAALAPVMARENRNVRPFRLLMALCNVRTGVWLPNPYWVPSISRARGSRRAAPDVPAAGGGRVRTAVAVLGQATGLPGVVAVLREGLGWTSLMSRHVYVTDGGQLENLGLVVALRRKPATVWVLDASGDPEDSFSTLGQALAMARIDAGIEVPDLDLRALRTGDDGHARSGFATTDFRYADGTTGRLVYVKAVLADRLPPDLQAYRAVDAAFPLTGTGDQLYGEFDFEAYRMLGEHLTRAALHSKAQAVPATPPARVNGARPGASAAGPATADVTTAGLRTVDLTTVDLTTVDLTTVDLTTADGTQLDLTNLHLEASGGEPPGPTMAT